MRAKEYLVLFLLAALWGASFLFIKEAITSMSPLTLVAIRLLVGALGLLAIVPFKPAVMAGWTARLRGFFIVAIFNAIIPYIAISWGEEQVTSGMAAILNATTPLVIIIVSHWWPGGERLTWKKAGAVLVGFAGVLILVGPAAISHGGSQLYLLGVLSVLLGAASYGFGSLFAHQLLSGLPSIQPAIGQTAMGAVLLCPVAGIALVASPPAQTPSLVTIAAALALALGGTSLAYICYYWLLERVGAANTLIVTYLLPCMALVYGALWLGESISPNAIGGLALVLLGIFFAGRQSSKKHGQPTHAEEGQQAQGTPIALGEIGVEEQQGNC
jgi:drug/metabolite transporter (DMT)-like permease